jgi:hypothetical protein
MAPQAIAPARRRAASTLTPHATRSTRPGRVRFIIRSVNPDPAATEPTTTAASPDAANQATAAPPPAPPRGPGALAAMLERLFASMVNGPAMNCRPHNSRQRIDLTQLAGFDDIAPSQVLLDLLGEPAKSAVTARVSPPRKGLLDRFGEVKEDDEKLSDADRKQLANWRTQQAALTKLRTIADDARTYTNDTGVHVLHVGWPLLSLPPGSFGGGRGQASRRVLAPIAFIPVTVSLKAGARSGVELECWGEGVDRVLPNEALLAWLEQQSGVSSEGLFEDTEGTAAWKEITALVAHVAKLLQIEPPVAFAPADLPAELELRPAPRTDDEASEKPAIFSSAVLGLYPLANQGLLRDTKEMAAASDHLGGPVRPFLFVDAKLDDGEGRDELPPRRQFSDERYVALADPYQSRAVRLARRCTGLVVHGPPGTGKSQTITNIISDHLARGQRVLFVCDKRTALDVVANRLDHLGLGDLCAVVHDPQRDQKDLYRSIRDQLENLAEAKPDEKAAATLDDIDRKLQAIHDQLSQTYDGLMRPGTRADEGEPSFHELVGRWLAIDAPAVEIALPSELTLKHLDDHAESLHETLARGVRVQYGQNPWPDATDMPLSTFLATPADLLRQRMAALVPLAERADLARDPSILPFPAAVDVVQHAARRATLADQVEPLSASIEPRVLKEWALHDETSGRTALQRIAEAKPLLDVLAANPDDNELRMSVAASPPDLPLINRGLTFLAEYVAIAGGVFAFLQFAKKNQAKEVLSRFGLPLSPANAERVQRFLTGLRARTLLRATVDQLDGQPSNPVAGLGADDAVLRRALDQHAKVGALWDTLRQDASIQREREAWWRAAGDPAKTAEFVRGLRLSGPRAEAIAALLTGTGNTPLGAAWRTKFDAALRAGDPAAAIVGKLNETLPTLEDVIRIADALKALPEPLRVVAMSLLKADVDADTGVANLRRTLLQAAIVQRIQTDPRLRGAETAQVNTAFQQYAKLQEQKRDVVRDFVHARWLNLQQRRLLAPTGGRLNSLGADVKRRLMLRGEKVMRLRQVVALGAKTEGGDPLMDLRPVWMASPETVAQVFQREPLFDVIVFDEASQCRLEEALPVLTRGRRVVIAGDPKQLPPTRFFESTVATSDDDEGVETDQDLFEAQQGATEDLLAAALGLDIRQCYLDVHYRSKNADLIEFSNEHFYGSRLQAVPGHPSKRAKAAPVTLYEVGGVYEKRTNEAEADKVVEIVSQLLDAPKPEKAPSVGIACFNLAQRDLIVEKLDEKAEHDEQFADRLAAARERSGEGSFEGLFVKNLENVQGDERDHMIISTTYGPDAQGRFYKRFGPLGMVGGGRRLNVLVTRARLHVHLITSIPASQWKALPPVPPDQQAGGGWLLFAYIGFAHALRNYYEQMNATTAAATAGVSKGSTKVPSPFVETLAARLIRAQPTLAGETYWGNDGFGIDLALRPADKPDGYVGVQCDLTRFPGAGDPVEWEAFRTAIHEGQGWAIQRVWTPSYFRDPAAVERDVLKSVSR